jgi:hypothetical protein
MPVAKAKPKARARVGAKAKRAAIKKAFGRDISTANLSTSSSLAEIWPRPAWANGAI